MAFSFFLFLLASDLPDALQYPALTRPKPALHSSSTTASCCCYCCCFSPPLLVINILLLLSLSSLLPSIIRSALGSTPRYRKGYTLVDRFPSTLPSFPFLLITSYYLEHLSSAPPRSKTTEPETLARTTHREIARPPDLPCLPHRDPSFVQFQPVPIASPARHPPPPTAINCLPRFNATPSLSVRPPLEPPFFSRYPQVAHFLLKLGTLLGPASKQTILLATARGHQTISSSARSPFITTPPAHILLPVECHLALVLEPDPVPSTPQNPHIANTPRHRRQSGGKRALLHLAQALHPGPDDPLLLVA